MTKKAKSSVPIDKKENEMYEEIKENFNYIRVENTKKVYYGGQIVLEIGERVKIPGDKFGVSGRKKYKEKSYKSFEDYKKFKQPLLKEEYKNIINCEVKGFNIKYSSKCEPNKENYDNLEKILEKYKEYLESNYKEKLEKSYKTYTKTKILIKKKFSSLEECLEFRYNLVTNTGGHPPFSKSDFISLQLTVDYGKIKNKQEFCEDLKKAVDIYNKEIGGQDEKIVQESLFIDSNMNKINRKLEEMNIELEPIEEEFGFKIQTKNEEKDGRCDNIYLNTNDNSIVFMEVKYNEGVIKTTQKTKRQKGNPGIASHLNDIYDLLYNNENKLEKEKRLNALSTRLANKYKFYGNEENTKILDKKKENYFIIFCAYSKSHKKAVEIAIKEELQKNKGNQIIQKLKEKGTTTILLTALVEDVKEVLSSKRKQKYVNIEKIDEGI